MCTSSVRFARQSVRPASSQLRTSMHTLIEHVRPGGRTASRLIDRAFIRDRGGRARAFLLCEQNPRPGFVHCTCAVPRRWRCGGGWRLARAAPPRFPPAAPTPHGDRGVARGPGRQHVPLPCVVAGLLQRADPHGPHTTRQLGMQRAQAAFHLGEMGVDAEDGCAPLGARGPLPRDANASRVDTRGTMATVRSRHG